MGPCQKRSLTDILGGDHGDYDHREYDLQVLLFVDETSECVTQIEKEHSLGGEGATIRRLL